MSEGASTARSDPQPVRVILTFDDGPIGVEHQESGYSTPPERWLDYAAAIMDTLDQANIQGVFYALVERFPAGTAPGDGVPQEVMDKFREGLGMIASRGHAVALHAFNHNAYQLLNQDPEGDIWALLDVMGGIGDVPWHHAWRPPYGGEATFADEEQIAARLGLTHRKWSIDSNDWQYHQDAMGALVPEWLWPTVVKECLSAGILSPTWASGKWLDILLHVNGRTSGHLGEILQMVQQDFNGWYGGGSGVFAPDGQFWWHTKDDPATLSDYLGR